MCFFFFKQKTAYEMRISDWSSDVCSSDLRTRSFPPNKKGRDFVVGDIHGHFKLLTAALNNLDFNPELDRIFSVGDLIDRGPDSIDILKWLEKPWFHAVRGNHEQMLIDCISGYGDIPRHI